MLNHATRGACYVLLLTTLAATALGRSLPPPTVPTVPTVQPPLDRREPVAWGGFPRLSHADKAATLEHAKRFQPDLLARRKAATGVRRNFVVYFNYQLDPSTTPSQAAYLKNTLLPAVAATFRQFVQVKVPLAGNLTLTPRCQAGLGSCDGTCPGGVTIPQSHLLGGPGVDADLIVYVTTSRTSCDGGNTLAYATGCLQDPATNRPVAGTINFCSYGPNQFQQDLETSVHEMLHVLGMNSDFFFSQPGVSFDSFVDDNGAPLMQSEIVASFSERGTTVTKIVLPRVVAAAQAQFGCPTLNGAELEDDGGQGSAATHWEQRIFNGELMISTGSSDYFAGRHMLTNLTLALLEDSGWYAIDYSFGRTNRFGSQAGCLFPVSSCSEIFASSDTTAQSYFCDTPFNPASQNAPLQCTSDFGAIGACTSQPAWDGCSMIQAYSNGDCVQNSQFGGPGAAGSRCFDLKGGSSAVCAAASCSDGALQVQFDGSSGSTACPTGSSITFGQSSTIFGSSGGQTAVCPDNVLLCGTSGAKAAEGFLACPNDCTLNGRCESGVCQCFLGRVGSDCSGAICTGDASCSGNSTCHTDGLCDAGMNDPVQFPTTAGGLVTGRTPVSPNTAHSTVLAWTALLGAACLALCLL